MPKKISLVLIVIALAGFYLHYWSDRQIIKRSMTKLAMQISKVEPETPLQMALKMKQVKDTLHTPCHVIIPERAYTQPLATDLIIRYLIYYRERYEIINLTFAEIAVEIPLENKATVTATTHLFRQTKTDPLAMEEELYTVWFKLIKKENSWRIREIILPQLLIE